MRTLMIMIAALLLGGPAVWGQNSMGSEAIMNFLGTDDPQDLDHDEVERLEFLLEYPLKINISDESNLRRSGLFSSYQVAVITDYISRHGPIRTSLELSYLDGFSASIVERLSPFIDLSVGESEHKEVRQQVAVRGSGKWLEDQSPDAAYAIKYRINARDRLNGTVAMSRSYGESSMWPSSFSGSLAWSPGSRALKVVAGDFHARFGQGLTLWSNSFMADPTSPDNFMKRPSGITQPWSFTGSGSLTGCAVEIGSGHWKVSAMSAFPGIKETRSGILQFMPAVNLAWFGRSGHVSLTNVLHMPMSQSSPKTAFMTGLDAAFCVRGVNIFGEIACDWLTMTPKALAGTRFRAGEQTDMAVQVKAFMSDQYGIACSGMHSLRKATLLWVIDACSTSPGRQIKVRFSYEYLFNECWKLKLRLSERVRTWGLPFRTDARVDLAYTGSSWTASMRMNILSSDKTGCLSYVEGGFNGEKLTAYLRQGIFFIDDWDDRIYVYERDAPGSFNVPAMYGRGVWTSMTASIKMPSSLRLYARASYVCYPFMEKKKPGKAELKLQLQYRF